MARGFRQRDPVTGQILVDITSRLPRLIGWVSITGGASGSITVPSSGSNPAFFYFSPSNDGNCSPTFSQSEGTGDVISWVYSGSVGQIPLTPISGILSYGRW